MRIVEIILRPTTSERSTLVAFVEEMTMSTGVRPLSDHVWLDLNDTESRSLIAVRVAEADRTLALALISEANDASVLEVIVRDDFDDAPDAALERRFIHDDVAETAIDTFARRVEGALAWWVDDPTDADSDFARTHGLTPTRTLHEMLRALPTEQRATVATRPFKPGADNDAWLHVNNRAFADHGEQGGWTNETLSLRLDEPWFDADGFRLYEQDGQLAAFCWTKLHDESTPTIGEIYVIAVDPDFHGKGLGKQLTLAGLDSIFDRDVAIANLYVDADNETAVRLYERLGFTIHRTRRAFTGTPPVR
jgi:mycothiol synthase